ncbi:hypothetical protein D920_02927 [Enterococcus faecalis 13-SD-W-01]|nr:hypothetical protein D920_02927 [Enterococcus faecalis 13-SD-W-01]
MVCSITGYLDCFDFFSLVFLFSKEIEEDTWSRFELAGIVVCFLFSLTEAMGSFFELKPSLRNTLTTKLSFFFFFCFSFVFSCIISFLPLSYSFQSSIKKKKALQKNLFFTLKKKVIAF